MSIFVAKLAEGLEIGRAEARAAMFNRDDVVSTPEADPNIEAGGAESGANFAGIKVLKFIRIIIPRFEGAFKRIAIEATDGANAVVALKNRNLDGFDVSTNNESFEFTCRTAP